MTGTTDATTASGGFGSVSTGRKVAAAVVALVGIVFIILIIISFITRIYTICSYMNKFTTIFFTNSI